MKHLPLRFVPTGQQIAAAWALVRQHAETPSPHCASCQHLAGECDECGTSTRCELDSDDPSDCPAYAHGMDDPLHRDFHQ